MRKPLFQPRQSTLTQLATPKPVHQPSFDLDFEIAMAFDQDSNDIWDDPETFEPKAASSTSKPPVTTRNFQPKTASSQSKSSSSFNFAVKDIARKSQSKLSISKKSNNGTKSSLVQTHEQSPTNAFAFDTNLLLPDDDDFDVPLKKKTPIETIVLSQSPSIASGILQIWTFLCKANTLNLQFLVANLFLK